MGERIESMTVHERIKKRRLELGLTLLQVADSLSVASSTVLRYETSEIYNFGINRIAPLAAALKTTPAYLMGWSDESGLPLTRGVNRSIRVLGNVAAGIPITAVEDAEEIIYIHEPEDVHTEYFALRVRGDSMEPRLREGDVIIVRHDSGVESGKLAVVLLGDEAAVKKVVKENGGITLVSFNPSYPPRHLTPADIIHMPVHILGTVIESRTRYT